MADLVCAYPGCGRRLERSRRGGRPPRWCPEHRGKRPHRRAGNDRSGRPRLTVVPEVLEPPEDVPAPDDTFEAIVSALLDPPPAPATAGKVGQGITEVIAALPIGHPQAPALRPLLERLAAAVEHPVTQADPRVLVAVSRELRSALDQLVPPEKGGESDDPFGLADLRPTLVDPQAG